ncbi:uncharacterized protein LOC115269925 [Aedes albopictus]|uniref:Reverse transcriptase Ty1/copia-type domain-containing protein n=1 Tax=Aedes albopictus TaxID=7160 RepID=A0ABM1YJ87_AEDAL|nr:uncharacterized protein LOC115269925 [Aedes albopictus]
MAETNKISKVRSNIGVRPERFAETIRLTVHQAEPKTFDEAVSESAKWRNAMHEEMASHREHGTWDITELPPGRKAIGCKWVYKRKQDETGQVARYKARLAAQGFSQKFGTDYDLVFASVVK